MVLGELLAMLVGRIDFIKFPLQFVQLLAVLSLDALLLLLKLIIFGLKLLPKLLSGVHQVVDIGSLPLDYFVAFVEFSFKLSDA